jgi:ATP-binding cassette subfamily B protein
MVAAWHGLRFDDARVRELARTGPGGTSLAGMIRAATALGLEARGLRAADSALGGIVLPAIAHCTEDGRHHYVVVFAVTPRRITLGDPARGQRNLMRTTFRQIWTGILIVVTRHCRRADPNAPGASLAPVNDVNDVNDVNEML